MPTKPAPPSPRFVGSAPTTPKVQPRQWQEILADLGYPPEVLVVDFETYFDSTYHMGKSGDGLTTIEYVMDRRFEVVGCSFWKFGDEPLFQAGEEMVATQLGCYQKQFGLNLSQCTVVIQNAKFDALILSRKYKIHPPFLIDILALARAWNSRQNHGLKVLAPQFGLPAKGDTQLFDGLGFRRRLLKSKKRGKGPKPPVLSTPITPEQVQALGEYANNDAVIEGGLLKVLLPKLSNPAVELNLQHHTLELWTKPTLMVDFAKGEEIIKQMDAEIDAALRPIAVVEHTQHAVEKTDGEIVSTFAGQTIIRSATREEISGNNSYEALLVEALKSAGENPQRFMKPIKNGSYKLADAKDDPEREVLLKHPNERVRQLAQARAAIRSWPLHIARVQRITKMARADGGLLPVPLKYCGAHTGRWSGDESINLQNLGSRGHDLISLIRHMLTAQPGHTLVIADAAQIEARVNDWLAGQWDSVEKWAKGEDQYSQFASLVVGYNVHKPSKTEIPSIAKRLTWARNVIGKIGVLGMGYGMGAEKAVDWAQGQIDLPMAEKIVKAYRESHAAVVQLWKDLERAFIYTAKYKRSCSLPRGIQFDSIDGCDVVVTLPNGRELKYTKVRLEPGRFGGDSLRVWNEVEHSWEHCWGGVLCENIVQAISRDILAEALLRLEDHGFHVVFHCHDELVLHVPEDQGEFVLKLAVEELSARPLWAPQVPLGAEGCLSKFYKK